MCLSPNVCVSPCTFVSLSVSVSLTVFLCVSQCVSVFLFSLFMFLSLNVCVCVCVCVCVPRCTSSHPVPLGYDESFMSVVLRVHHGVLAVYFCHH